MTWFWIMVGVMSWIAVGLLTAAWNAYLGDPMECHGEECDLPIGIPLMVWFLGLPMCISAALSPRPRRDPVQRSLEAERQAGLCWNGSMLMSGYWEHREGRVYQDGDSHTVTDTNEVQRH